MSDSDEKLSDQETEQRRDEALKRALNTPPKPRKSDTEKSTTKKPPAK